MNKIILISGGARSGKSAYAQKRAESLQGARVFVATSPRIDAEMDERIDKHIQDRQGKGWQTIEEELDLAGAISSNTQANVILVDCLTLWINNILFKNSEKTSSISEKDIEILCSDVLDRSKNHPGTTIFVTNEVGSGIIPDSAETRLYRDLVGSCNQCFAHDADEVILVSCGIPMFFKPQ